MQASPAQRDRRARELERRRAWQRMTPGQRAAIREALGPAEAQLRLPIPGDLP